jgi:hypothetical protein
MPMRFRRLSVGAVEFAKNLSLGDSDSSALSSDSSHHRRQGNPHDAVFMMNGFPPPGLLLIQTLLDWRYSSIASTPFSRPRPEAL